MDAHPDVGMGDRVMGETENNALTTKFTQAASMKPSHVVVWEWVEEK